MISCFKPFTISCVLKDAPYVGCSWLQLTIYYQKQYCMMTPSRLDTHLHTHTHTNTQAHTHTHTHTSTHTHIHTRTQTRAHKHHCTGIPLRETTAQQNLI